MKTAAKNYVKHLLTGIKRVKYLKTIPS